MLSAEGGQQWMSNLRVHYQRLLGRAPDAQVGMLWDDDILYTHGGMRELSGHLTFLGYDRLDANWVYPWDDEAMVNANMPAHRATMAFKVLDGDDFPADYVVHCPDRVAHSHNVCLLKHPVMSMGFLEAEDRERGFSASRDAGRIDAYTLAIFDAPRLERIEDGGRAG
ncbi:MAG: hypothetical protein L0099_07315 [Acidobacteria bacterium]|nr:hypothetical protein [Acidobacteriota bacterium]